MLHNAGEMFGLCKAAFEEAGKPLTTREIALAVIRAKGWDEADMMLRKAVAYRLIQSLHEPLRMGASRMQVDTRMSECGRSLDMASRPRSRP